MNSVVEDSLAARVEPSAARPSRAAPLALVAAGVLVAAALAAQAGAAWHREMASDGAQLGGNGALVSVALVGGQTYYGNLVQAGPAFVRLENVYYVQTAMAPGSNQADNRLVNRHKADWHGPAWMAIPVEKVLMVEGVGAGSRLANLIEQEKKLPAP